MIRAFLRRRMEHHLTQTAAVFPRAFLTGEDMLSACTLAAVGLELVSPAPPDPGSTP